MADFSKYTNYKNNAGVSSVVFGAKATVLEVELNEMQEIQKHLMNSLIKNIIGNGISDINKLTYNNADKVVRLLDDCWITAEGYHINCSNIWINVLDGNTVYLQVWEEIVDHNSVLNVEGYNKATEYVSNWIKDDRASSETTKRMVVKYTLSTQTNSARFNVPIAKISNGIMTKLIKEANLARLYDKVNSIDEYDMRDVYGVEIDFENGTIERLAGSIGKTGGTDFDNVNAFKRRRCLITQSDGVVVAYHGDGTYYNDTTGITTKSMTSTIGTTIPAGTRINTMVEQNKFYYKVVPIKIDKISNGVGYHIRKVRYYISDTYKPGFKIHPAFQKKLSTGAMMEFDKIYIGAYKSVAYDSNGIANDTTYEDTAEELDYSASGLASISGHVPVSGLYYNLSISNMRKMLNNMDSDGFWRLKDITVLSMDILLFLIEYATFDAQSILGKGYVNIDGDHIFNLANVTGSTASLGNKSSIPLSNDGSHSISYRGEEDIYGGLFEFIEGFKIDNVRSVWSNILRPNDPSTIYTNNNIYTDIGNPGHINAFGFDHNCDWMFIPSQTNSESAIVIDDSFTLGEQYQGVEYVLAYGGDWRSGDDAGMCCMKLTYSTRYSNCGNRIVYFPYKLGTNIG